MTQYSRPSSDIALNGWTNPSWSVIEEGCASYDAAFTSSPAKTSATLQCALSSVTDPTVSSGYGLRVRGYVQSNGVATINIKLYCGTTLIKTWTPGWTTSSAEYSTSLTTGEADSITNHADMRVWFEFVYTSGSQGRGYIDAFDFEVPNPPITGTASITLSNLEKTLTGAVNVGGTLSKTLSDISSTLTGAALVSGLVDKNIDSVSLTATGTVINSFYYEIQRHDGDEVWESVDNPTSSPFDDITNLISGTTYTYRVRQVIYGVPGIWSNEAVVTYQEGGPHGVASLTLESVGLQGTAIVEIKGIANITLGSITNASTGKSDIAGSSSSNLETIGLTATVISEIKGALSTALPAPTISASGKLDSVGNFNNSLLDISISASGQAEAKGLSSVTLLNTNLVATGQAIAGGVSSIILENIEATLTGETDVIGSLNKLLDDIGLETSGVIGFMPIEGIATITFSSISLFSVGVVPISGTFTKSLEALSTSLSGGVEAKSSVSVVLDDISTSLSGVVEVTGLLSTTIEDVTGTSDVISSISGSLAKTLDPIGAISSGVVAVVGTLSKSLADIEFSITGALSSFGAGTPNLETITASVTATVLVAGTCSSSLAEVGVSTEGYVYDIAIISPVIDEYQGTWTASTGTDLYECVNEASPSDLDFMQSELNPTYSPVVVALAEAPDLGFSIDHTLSYRIGQNGSGSLQLLVELRENYVNESSQGNLIASWQHTLGEMTTYESTLTESQANSIVNYSSLFVRMVAEV